jgi:hypothetical protein
MMLVIDVDIYPMEPLQVYETRKVRDRKVNEVIEGEGADEAER